MVEALLLVSLAISAAVIEEPDLDLSCGPASLLIAAELSGVQLDRSRLVDAFETPDKAEKTFADLTSVAEAFGLATKLVHLDASVPPNSPLPFIAHVRKSSGASEPNHFLVVFGVSGDKVQVIDGTRPPRWVSHEAFSRLWDGWGLYVGPNQDAINKAVSSRSRKIVVLMVVLVVLGAVVGSRFIPHKPE